MPATPETPAADTTDLDLIGRIASGDAGAMAEFYDRHSTLLFSIAHKVVGDQQEAEEVLQDAFRKLWESAPGYDGSLGKPTSWAVVITRNKAIDRLRALQRRNAVVTQITKEASAGYPERDDHAAREMVSRERGNLLRGALSALPVEQRLAIELAFFTGYSQAEVADHLKEPLGTIKARIRRGMVTMREILEAQL